MRGRVHQAAFGGSCPRPGCKQYRAAPARLLPCSDGMGKESAMTRHALQFLLLFPLTLAAVPALSQEAAAPEWAMETSDVPVDPGFTFGALPNGMRYVLRSNDRPENTVLVR